MYGSMSGWTEIFFERVKSSQPTYQSAAQYYISVKTFQYKPVKIPRMQDNLNFLLLPILHVTIYYPSDKELYNKIILIISKISNTYTGYKL